MKVETQTQNIIKYLENGKKLTALDALKMFQCFRLSARIYDIKKLGYDIKSEFQKTNTGKAVMGYYLKKSA